MTRTLPIVPQRFLAIEGVNYNSPERWNALANHIHLIPDFARACGFGGVWWWGGTGHWYDETKPRTEFNRTMLPTNPDDWDQTCSRLLEMRWQCRDKGLLFGWHEGDISQVVFGKWPNVRREWSHRVHHAQQMKRIATVRKFTPDFVSIDNCGNRAGMIDADGAGWKATPELDDAAMAAKYPREVGSLQEGVDMFRGGLPDSHIVIEPSSAPAQAWWKKRLAPTDMTMQQVDFQLNRTHDPDAGKRSTDDFLILAKPPARMTLAQMNDWMGRVNAQGSHAIVKCWDVFPLAEQAGITVPGG